MEIPKYVQVEYEDMDISSPSPSNYLAKKKRRFALDRASLARRTQPPRPGSKRHQRHLNETYLISLSESEFTTDAETDTEIVDPLGKEWKSTFQELLQDSEKFKLWEPFMDVTEQEQARMFDALHINTHSNRKKVHNTKKGAITGKSRKLLKQHADTIFLQELDAVFRNYLGACNEGVDSQLLAYATENFSVSLHAPKGATYAAHQTTGSMYAGPAEDYYGDTSDDESDEEEAYSYASRKTRRPARKAQTKLCLQFNTSFHRMLAHHVCGYYELTSYSENLDDGRRVTIINRPKSKTAPKKPLHDYLKHD